MQHIQVHKVAVDTQTPILGQLEFVNNNREVAVDTQTPILGQLEFVNNNREDIQSIYNLTHSQFSASSVTTYITWQIRTYVQRYIAKSKMCIATYQGLSAFILVNGVP